jgi:ssDNA-binding Zn-finger/Zn-ribbon topoisomerase 1
VSPELSNFKLHHFKARKTYVVAEIRESLFPEALQETSNESLEEKISPVFSTSELNSQRQNKTKTCPKCSSGLILKVAKKGKHKGEHFLACSAFPECRHIEKEQIKQI